MARRNTGPWMWGETVDLLEQAERLQPDNWVAPYNAACALAELGRHDQAIEHLQRSVINGLPVRGLLTEEPMLGALSERGEFQHLTASLPDRPAATTEALPFEEP